MKLIDIKSTRKEIFIKQKSIIVDDDDEQQQQQQDDVVKDVVDEKNNIGLSRSYSDDGGVIDHLTRDLLKKAKRMTINFQNRQIDHLSYDQQVHVIPSSAPLSTTSPPESPTNKKMKKSLITRRQLSRVLSRQISQDVSKPPPTYVVLDPQATPREVMNSKSQQDVVDKSNNSQQVAKIRPVISRQQSRSIKQHVTRKPPNYVRFDSTTNVDNDQYKNQDIIDNGDDNIVCYNEVNGKKLSPFQKEIQRRQKPLKTQHSFCPLRDQEDEDVTGEVVKERRSHMRISVKPKIQAHHDIEIW